MNREIKFRAWNNRESKPEVKMIYGVVINELGEVCMPDGDWWSLPLMQYTGLKDKKGRDIYEGDIVKYDNSKYEVLFNGGSFQLKTGSGYYAMSPQYCEIIGNIYENPNLLT